MTSTNLLIFESVLLNPSDDCMIYASGLNVNPFNDFQRISWNICHDNLKSDSLYDRDMSYEKELINKLKQPNEEFESYLERARKFADEIKEKDEWLWFILLQSYGTLGNSNGGTIANEQNMQYSKLASLTSKQRKETIRKYSKENGVRFPNMKTDHIDEAFQIIANKGGLKAVSATAISLPSQKEKIEFLKQFKGIGNKYARNAWMDLHDTDFINSIAVDSNINKILDKLGLSGDDYLVQERKLVSIAKAAGMTGWELDRILYKFTDSFLGV